MSSVNETAPGPRVVPAPARELAARLSALFEKDRGIAVRLSGAQSRLCHANDRLRSGLAPDVFELTGKPTGHRQLAELIGGTIAAGEPGPGVVVLSVLQEIHWQVHRGFCEYQSACEDRRQLAADIGETIRQFVDALVSAGWTEDQARNANVHQLAQAWPASSETGSWR